MFLGSLRKRVLFALLAVLALALTLAAAVRFAVPLTSMPAAEVRRLDTGWFLQDGDALTPLPPLPCEPDLAGDRLTLVRSIDDAPGEDVLVVQTRYQSLRVWADDALIYDAARGREHALGSMWHFIPCEDYAGASTLRVEFTRYDQADRWEISTVLQGHPDTIRLSLLSAHLPAIVVWTGCMLFTLLLLVAGGFMALRKIKGASLALTLAAFVFLSGVWILLDSKVTTMAGGNYALTYFFSYCAFYLLPVPMLVYSQLLLRLNSRPLRLLTWIAAGNTPFWMLLHLLGVVPIRKTAVSVHLIILLFVVALARESFKRRADRSRPRPVCTAWGICLVLAVALASIVLDYAGVLPNTNSSVVFIWGLFALILSMIMDAVLLIGQLWREQQNMRLYQKLATQDRMTLLSNRNAYELRVRELVAAPPAEVAFVLFDIDRMKRINDTHGHHCGDQVIAMVAHCLLEVFGPLGECYRIGGDEFCAILTASGPIPDKLKAFDRLVALRNTQSFPVRVSHGWAARRFPGGTAASPEDIVGVKTAADEALYRSKGDGHPGGEQQ